MSRSVRKGGGETHGGRGGVEGVLSRIDMYLVGTSYMC